MTWRTKTVVRPDFVRAGEVVGRMVQPGDVQKPGVALIRLLAGLGVEGDAHLGRTVQHRSRVARDPSQPNLRQVHLIHGELHDELRAQGFDVTPGVMGENVTTRDVELLALPTGSRLRLGEEAVVEVSGLRNPCVQLDHFQQGLMAAVLDNDDDGNLVRKAAAPQAAATSLSCGRAIRRQLSLSRPATRSSSARLPWRA
jgi:hypothetical protein